MSLPSSTSLLANGTLLITEISLKGLSSILIALNLNSLGLLSPSLSPSLPPFLPSFLLPSPFHSTLFLLVSHCNSGSLTLPINLANGQTHFWPGGSLDQLSPHIFSSNFPDSSSRKLSSHQSSHGLLACEVTFSHSCIQSIFY